MRNLTITLTLLAALAALPGCSAAKTKVAAEQGVAKFHSQLDEEQYHDIYAQVSAEFQKSAPETEMVEFFAAVHRKLGNVQKAEEQGFYVNFGMTGTTVTLTYKTTFVNGPASEQFIWRAGEPPVLVNYRVDSRLLITK